ncbi:unnamed protein product [Closterium sp. NIES-64]|nr:unnamed protein product [Closterium sp. NIES-64]
MVIAGRAQPNPSIFSSPLLQPFSTPLVQREVIVLGRLSHPHLVHLHGYCIEDHEALLVYEFMTGGSLDKALLHSAKEELFFSWSMRLKVAEYDAKLADFGMVRVGPDRQLRSIVSTCVMGTPGYIDPSYMEKDVCGLKVACAIQRVWGGVLAEWGAERQCTCCQVSHLGAKGDVCHLSAKSDVYSFGVLLLELVTGRRVAEEKETIREVAALGFLSHPHLVHLHGYCTEGDEALLVYDFMPGGSLDEALEDKEWGGSLDSGWGAGAVEWGATGGAKEELFLSWSMRLKVAVQVAEALAYMHGRNFIHGNLKAASVLLSPVSACKGVGERGGNKADRRGSKPTALLLPEYDTKLAGFGKVRVGPETEQLPMDLTRILGFWDVDLVIDVHAGVCLLINLLINVHAGVCLLINLLINVHAGVCLLINLLINVHAGVCLLINLLINVHAGVCLPAYQRLSRCGS